MSLNIIVKERVWLEITTKKEIERKSFLGLFTWDVVINSEKVSVELKNYLKS